MLKIVKKETDPHVIEEDRLMSLKEGRRLNDETPTITTTSGRRVAEIRLVGSFDHKGIWLSNKFDWVLGKDEDGEIVVVPLEK